jgi:hypothetical protein
MRVQKRSATRGSVAPPSVSRPAGQAAIADLDQDVWPGFSSESPELRAAIRAFERIERKFKLNIERRRQLLEALLEVTTLATNRAAAAPLPNKAPELWANRDGRKEDPITFIRRVYAPWVRRGLTRAHLLDIDRPLYNALGVWFHRHPEACFPGEEHLVDRLDSLLTTRPSPSRK